MDDQIGEVIKIVLLVKEPEFMKRQLALQQITPALQALNQQDYPQLHQYALELIQSKQWYEVVMALHLIEFIIPYNNEIKLTFYKEALTLIKFPENRVQEYLILILTKLSLKFPQETTEFFNEIQKELLSLIKKTTEEEQNNYVSIEKMVELLQNSPFSSQANKIKIIEPMFQCKYTYTNPQNILIQGLLNACLELIKFANGIVSEELLTIIERSLNHQNKYVRKFSVDSVNQLSSLKVKHELIFRVIEQALLDESIEVRKVALDNFTIILNQKDLYSQEEFETIKERFCIGLLINSHMENLTEIGANLSRELYDVKDPSQPPILGVITKVKEKCLEQCLKACYEGTISRYFQIRSSCCQTLQTIILFLKGTQLLNLAQLTKVLLNATFFETDPQARASGMSSMYHMIRVNQLESDLLLPILECASFHLSDVPFNCKELSAKIVSLLYFKGGSEVVVQKLKLLRDKQAIFCDFVGVPTIGLMNEQIHKSIDQQGGKDRVINKHSINLILGLSLVWRWFVNFKKDEMDEQNINIIRKLLTDLVYYLHNNELFKDGLFDYKALIYITIAEGTADLKLSNKRLPIRMLDESEFLLSLSRDLKGNYLPKPQEILQLLGKVVGESILNGRLQSI